LKNQGRNQKKHEKSALGAGQQVSIIRFEKYITKLQQKKEKAAELINIRKDPIQ